MTDHTPEQPSQPPIPAAPPTDWPTTLHVSPPPAKRRLTPLTAGLVGLAAGAAIMGGIWAITATAGSGGPGTFTLEGTFTLNEDATEIGDGDCAGGYDSGYDDIREGTGVTVYGADGDVIATGALGDSTYSDYACSYSVAVEDVPKGEKFYKVEVSHRGTLQLSAEEAENGGFAGSLG
jgi:hypothetical protein